MFAAAHLLGAQLREIGKVEAALRSLVASLIIRTHCIEVILNPRALDIESGITWEWSIPMPARRPFREARLRIDAEAASNGSADHLLDLVADAMAAQSLVRASPELSLNLLAKREGRCRTQLARLLRLSWMSPRIIEAIVEGSQPNGLTRRGLLTCDMPVDWAEQERRFGFAA